MKRKVLIIFALIAVVGTASAQKKWSYSLGLGGALKSGNVNSMTLNNNGGVERNDSTLAFSADYAIIYGEQNSVEYDKGFTANMKFDVFQYDRWSPFFSASYINNKYKGYEYKTSLLLGAKYRIYTLPKVCDYSISGAFVYDYVEYFQKNTTALRPQVARLSLRFKVKQKIGDVVTINHSTFYQPSLYDFGGDYIVSSTTKFENKLGNNLFFDIAFTYEYLSIVPEGIQNHDIATTATLRLKF